MSVAVRRATSLAWLTINVRLGISTYKILFKKRLVYGKKRKEKKKSGHPSKLHLHSQFAH